MKRKLRWIDLALLPFGLCVLFLLLLGKLFGLTYKQISVVFNLWVQGAVLALSGMAPFGVAVYKMLESFSMWWLALSAVLLIYGIAYVYAFIKMLQHYHLPFNDAYYLCVRDLKWLARLSDGEPAHFYTLLSDPLRIEYSYLLLSLFTLKLIIDGSITNDYKSSK